MKYKAIIVSDLHLGTDASKAKEFLDFLENTPTELLILNGDIVDGWALGRGSKWKKNHTKVLSRLLDVSRKTKIIWIRGNHDEFLHEFMWIHLGNISIAESFVLHLTDYRRYYVFHGDVLDVFITKWKWLAQIGGIGYEIALRINTLYNRFRKWRKKPYFSISKRIKEGVKTAVNYINDFETAAIKLAEQHNCTGVICGHIHKAEDRYINGKHYLNSGDWVESLSAILITPDNDISIKFFH